MKRCLKVDLFDYLFVVLNYSHLKSLLKYFYLIF